MDLHLRSPFRSPAAQWRHVFPGEPAGQSWVAATNYLHGRCICSLRYGERHRERYLRLTRAQRSVEPDVNRSTPTTRQSFGLPHPLYVERLNIANLMVQYFGYLCDGERPNLVRRLKELGAGRGSTVEYIKPPNPKSKSNYEQLRIGIGRLAMRSGQEQFHSSDAFRIVMALA
jgi:hypothetical protein